MIKPPLDLILGLVVALVWISPFFLIASHSILAVKTKAIWFFGGLAAVCVLSYLIAYFAYRLMPLSPYLGGFVQMALPILLPWALFGVFRHVNRHINRQEGLRNRCGWFP